MAAAQAEAKALAIRDYAARVRSAVTEFEQNANEDTFLLTMQQHHDRVARELVSVSLPKA